MEVEYIYKRNSSQLVTNKKEWEDTVNSHIAFLLGNVTLEPNYRTFCSATLGKIYLLQEMVEISKDFLKEDYSSECYALNRIVTYGLEREYAESYDSIIENFFKTAYKTEMEYDDNEVICSFADLATLLSFQEDYILLPVKWLSTKLYKVLENVLKPLGYEKTKLKKKVCYKSTGKVEKDLVLKILKESNGIDLSTEMDFFPTPVELVKEVQQLAQITDKDLILEPSAGMGDLLAGLNKDNIKCVELNPYLATILKANGYQTYNSSFEDYHAPNIFDKIIMNPPFGKRLDAKHIVKAFEEELKEGGTLVAISSQAIFTATDKASKKFQEIVAKYSTSKCKYDNMFKESGKGTNISVVVTKFVKG